MIKLLKLFLVLTTITTICACGNDDDATTTNELEGTWNLVSLSVEGERTNPASPDVLMTSAIASNFTESMNLTGNTYNTTGGYLLSWVIENANGTESTLTTSESRGGSGTYTSTDNEITLSTTRVSQWSNMDTTFMTVMQYTIDTNGDLIWNINTSTTEEFAGQIETTTANVMSRYEKQ